jgi:hypothetical protein
MKRLISLCCILVLSLTVTAASLGQTSTLFRPRTFNAGARALGFAEAFVADIYNVNSMYWNPASLVYMQNTSIVLNHGLDRTSNIMNENLSTPLFVKKGEVVAVGLSVNHIGSLQSSPLADFKAVQYGYDVAYSREVVPTFCVGAGLGIRYGTTSAENLWAISGSVSVFYAPSPEVSYGAVFTGFGNGIRYNYDGSSTILATQQLPRILTVGASLRFPASANKTFLTLSIANEKVFEQEGLRYKGGVEYVALRLVALRVGYIVDEDLQAATYGIGMRAGRWHLEYGMLPSRLTDRLYQFTLGFDFWDTTESIRTDR